MKLVRDSIGQMITFATQLEASSQKHSVRWVRMKPGETIKKFAARIGHPEMAKEIAKLNHIRSITKPQFGTRPYDFPVAAVGLPPGVFVASRIGRRIKIPGTIASAVGRGNVLNVHCDDPAPTITDGYAMFDVVNRPGRKGISRFLGYNPAVYEIAVQFEGYSQPLGASGVIESKIAVLEKMAGRGQHSVTADGPPPVIAISVTDNDGNQVWLVPPNYQRSAANPTAPLWRISGISWDKTPLRDDQGRRLRQKATVTATEYTPISLVVRSASARAKRKATEHVTVRERAVGGP